MSVSVSKNINAGTEWIGGDGTYMGGVYGNYTLTATINDAMTQLSMNIRCNSLTMNPSQGDGTRYNCWFLTALIPPRAAIEFLDDLAPADGDTTNWSEIQSDIAWSSFHKSWGEIAGNCVCAIGVPEDSSWGFHHSGISAGTSATVSKALSASDFDADGNYIGSALLIVSDRFWNSGSTPISGQDVDGQWIDPDDYMIRTSGYNLTFDDFRFFPGKIKKGNDWMSHNRYYSASNQGHASILKSGNWRDVTNTINPRAATVNKGIIRASSQWMTQALIGTDKDTR